MAIRTEFKGYHLCWAGKLIDYDGQSCWPEVLEKWPNEWPPESKYRICKCAQIYKQVHIRYHYGYTLPDTINYDENLYENLPAHLS